MADRDGPAALDPRQVASGLTRLARAARQWPESAHHLREALEVDLERLAFAAALVAQETGDPAGQILAQAVREAPRLRATWIDRLVAVIPEKTLTLRELVVVLLQRRLKAARRGRSVNRVLHLLTELSIGLAELGKPDEALHAAQEAADGYRRLAADDRHARRGDLAAALNTVSNRLQELGRHDESLAAIEEAAALYRTLAATEP
ncbi:MAG TPA: tetratricopeptide repeat protein, partial [Candidatus Dormibacteraeota bacterium]|nr:tetratricopeptide repeat protein [Candidatus Dormibacteraeota bacterium]